jgi:hypothetical protein
MSATVLYMSISLDGFVAGPNERSGKGSAMAGTACTSGTGDTVAITLHMSTARSTVGTANGVKKGSGLE